MALRAWIWARRPAAFKKSSQAHDLANAAKQQVGKQTTLAFLKVVQRSRSDGPRSYKYLHSCLAGGRRSGRARQLLDP